MFFNTKNNGRFRLLLLGKKEYWHLFLRKVFPVLSYLLSHRGECRCILNLGSIWRRMFNVIPWRLYAREKFPLHPLAKRVGGPRAALDAVGKRKVSYSCHELKYDTSAVQPIVSRYTDWPMQALRCNKCIAFNNFRHVTGLPSNWISKYVYGADFMLRSYRSLTKPRNSPSFISENFIRMCLQEPCTGLYAL
jgi:hypothetical protein